MLNYFETNYALLERWHPQLAARIKKTALSESFDAEVTKNGKMTVKVNGIYLHSKYDPEREASEWVANAVRGMPDSARLTVLGCGLGYHLVELVRQGFTAVVIEPSFQLFKLALAFVDLSQVIPCCDFLVGIPDDVVRRRYRDSLRHPVRAFSNIQRVFPDYFSALTSFATSLTGVAGGGFKILVVNPIYGGSLPISVQVADALREMGNEVVSFESEYFARAMAFAEKFKLEENGKEIHKAIASLLSQAVLLKVAEFKPDFVVALAQAPLLPDTLLELKRREVPVAFWFVEDHKVLDYWSSLAPFYSYFFVIQKGDFFNKLKSIGVENFAYLPTAANPNFHRPCDLTKTEKAEFGSDLSFLGAGYYNRQRLFRALTHLDFKIWGSDWPMTLPLKPLIQRNGERIDSETSVKIFNAAKVNLNLHSSTYCEGVDPNGDFVNPRTFEIAASGGFQLVDERALLPDLFSRDEIATFVDLADLQEKVKYFQDNEPERRAYAARARRRVLDEHTYVLRMEEMLGLLAAKFPVILERRASRAAKMDQLLERAQSQPGLCDLLFQEAGVEAFQLEDVYRRIDLREGKLNRAEKIFEVLRNITVVRGV